MGVRNGSVRVSDIMFIDPLFSPQWKITAVPNCLFLRVTVSEQLATGLSLCLSLCLSLDLSLCLSLVWELSKRTVRNAQLLNDGWTRPKGRESPLCKIESTDSPYSRSTVPPVRHSGTACGTQDAGVPPTGCSPARPARAPGPECAPARHCSCRRRPTVRAAAKGRAPPRQTYLAIGAASSSWVRVRAHRVPGGRRRSAMKSARRGCSSRNLRCRQCRCWRPWQSW